MGNQPSKMKQVTKTLNGVSVEVMSELSTEAAGSIENTQIINFAGTINRANIQQRASIRLDVLSSSDTNATLQSELENRMIAALTRRNNDFPQIARGMDTTHMRSIISNEVRSSMSQQSLARLAMAIGNTQVINFDQHGTYDQITVSQEASSVGQLVNSMNTRIANQLIAESSTDAKSESVTTNFAADIIGSVGGVISGVIDSIGGLFGLSPMTIIFLLVVVLIGGYLLKRRIDRLPPDATIGQILGYEKVRIKKKVPPPATGAGMGAVPIPQKVDPLAGLFQGRGEISTEPLYDTRPATPYQGGEHVSYPDFYAEAI